MQTFITSSEWQIDPSDVFKPTAQSLDDKRLNKQALEAWQILMTNLQLNPDGTARHTRGWINHPATLMWTGCDLALLKYINAMVEEWLRRGHQSTIAVKARDTYAHALEKNLVAPLAQFPEWMTDREKLEMVVNTHRQALSVKNWDYYSQFGWHKENPKTYAYVWFGSGYSSPAKELGVILG
jgi:hypothetical protein